MTCRTCEFINGFLQWTAPISGSHGLLNVRPLTGMSGINSILSFNFSWTWEFLVAFFFLHDSKKKEIFIVDTIESSR